MCFLSRFYRCLLSSMFIQVLRTLSIVPHPMATEQVCSHAFRNKWLLPYWSKYRFWQPPCASGIRSIFARSLGVGTSFTKRSGGDVCHRWRLLILNLARPASTVQLQADSPCQLVPIWSMDAFLRQIDAYPRPNMHVSQRCAQETSLVSCSTFCSKFLSQNGFWAKICSRNGEILVSPTQVYLSA